MSEGIFTGMVPGKNNKIQGGYKMNKKIARSIVVLTMMIIVLTMLSLSSKTAQATSGTIRHIVGLMNVGDSVYIKGSTTSANQGNTDTATVSLVAGEQKVVGAWVLSDSKINRYEILIQKGSTLFRYSPNEVKNHVGLTSEMVSQFNKQDKTTYQTVNTEWNFVLDANKLDSGTWTMETWAYTDAGSFCAGRITVNVGQKNITTYNHASCYGTDIKIGNDYNKVNKSYNYGTTSKFDFRLWAIHDQGLSGYSYKITSPNGGSYSSGSVTLNSIVRNDLADCNVCENLKIGQSASLANTGCNGSINLSKFKPGNYQIDITATPRKGNAFKVLQIDLKISANTLTFIGGQGASYIDGTGLADLVTVPNTTNKSYSIASTGQSNMDFKDMPLYKKDGYHFLGYADTQNATTAQYDENHPLPWSSSKTVYAVWRAKKHITYVPESGDEITLDDLPNGKFIVESGVFEKKDYILLGYTTTKGGTKVTHRIGVSYPLKADITLFPVWIPAKDVPRLTDDSKLNFEKYGIQDDDFKKDAYNRNLNEFTCLPEYQKFFDSKEVDDALRLFKSDEWARITDTARKQRINKWANVIRKQYGLSDKYQYHIVISAPRNEKEKKADGMLYRDTNEVWLSSDIMNNPEKVAAVTAHEIRHARQDERQENRKDYMDLLYDYDGKTYIEVNEAGDNYSDYENQILEAEAFACTKLCENRLNALKKSGWK